MAAIALAPQPVALVSYICADWLSASQGTEGKQIEAAAREAAHHLAERPSSLIQASDTNDIFDYNPVPLKVVGTARVKYLYSGRFEPRPYPLDE